MGDKTIKYADVLKARIRKLLKDFKSRDDVISAVKNGDTIDIETTGGKANLRFMASQSGGTWSFAWNGKVSMRVSIEGTYHTKAFQQRKDESYNYDAVIEYIKNECAAQARKDDRKDRFKAVLSKIEKRGARVSNFYRDDSGYKILLNEQQLEELEKSLTDEQLILLFGKK